MPVAEKEVVSAYNLRRHFGEYLKRLEHEDFLIEKKGNIVGELRNPTRDKKELALKLAGSVPGKTDLEADRNERLGL